MLFPIKESFLCLQGTAAKICGAHLPINLPCQIFVPYKHALPGLVQGGTREGRLDCTPNGPCVAEEEVLGELNPRQHLPVPLLILAGSFLPEEELLRMRIEEKN